MSNSIEAVKAKFTALLAGIAVKLDSKLGKTEPAASAVKLTNPFELRLVGDVDGSDAVYGNENVSLEVQLSATGLQRVRPSVTVKETINLAIDQLKQYDLQTLLGTNASKYDLSNVDIEVRVKDTIAGSPTLGAFVNAHSYVVYGVKDNRYVLISNESGKAIECYIRVMIEPVA